MKLEEIKARMREYQRSPDHQAYSLLITYSAFSIIFLGLAILFFVLLIKNNQWLYLIAQFLALIISGYFYLKADKIAQIRGGWT